MDRGAVERMSRRKFTVATSNAILGHEIQKYQYVHECRILRMHRNASLPMSMHLGLCVLLGLRSGRVVC